MLYKINLNQPIFFIWSGLFTKNESTSKQRLTANSENFEVFFPVQNDLILNINGEKIKIHENEIFIAPPYSVIKYDTHMEYEYSFYWFHFICAYNKLVEPDSLIHSGIDEIARLKSETSLNNFIILPEKYLLTRPESIIVQLNQLLNNSNLYHYTQRGNDFYLTLLLISISDDFLKTAAKKQKNKIKKTALISEWIRNNIAQDITLLSIAEHFNLNPSYLSRIFKKEQGISIKAYILTIKIDFAKRLLTTTTLSINEISEQSFFGDEKHFMRLFKQKNGITPSQYRNENSHLNFNSLKMNPSSPIPTQLGNKALRNLLSSILEENGRTKSDL